MRRRSAGMAEQKVALVTGCARGGIGFEYCRALAEQNCKVFATDIPQRMKEMSDLMAGGVEVIELDITSEESVDSAVDAVVSKCGRIDVIINNAGIGSVGPLAELPLDEIRRAYEINTLGQLRLIQRVVPHMASRRTGTIVNVGSVVGLAPTPWAGSYCASKAAVHAFSDVLRVELRPFGVNVVVVVPGAIRSNFGSATTGKLTNREWNLYRPFSEAIAERGSASQGKSATNTAVFARHVVNKVLSPSPPKRIVYGHMTGLFTALSWSPTWVRDLFFSSRFGLNKKLRS